MKLDRGACLVVLLGCGGVEVGETGGSGGESSSGSMSSSGDAGVPTTGMDSTSAGDDTTGETEEGCGAGWSEDLALGPGPVVMEEGVAVPIDVVGLVGRFTLDVAGETTTVDAQLTFRVGATAGRPIFDLRQEFSDGDLDGEAIAALWTRDFGGGPGAEMRVLDREVEACSEHVLTLRYPLVRPPGFAADPPDFEEDGVSWDFAFNDVAPRMFLEQWLPVNLIHDRHPIALSLEILGGAEDQRVITNGALTDRGDGAWDIMFGPDSTALSPMLVLSPASEVVSSSVTMDGVRFEVHRNQSFTEEPGLLLDIVTQAYSQYVQTTGEYLYPGFTAFITKNAGMEYDGGTTSDINALPHELFHSWFGRGVRPQRGSDGWIDEAWNEYNTGAPQFPAEPLKFTNPAVILCNGDPWSRTTPLAAYDAGKAVFAGIAAEAGVDELRASMRGFYEMHAGAPVTTEALERHLHCELQVPAVHRLFHRFVYGRPGEPGEPGAGDCA